MSQQPPTGPAGTPDEAADRPDPGTEPTENFAQSPYDVPAGAATERVGPTPDYGQAPDPTRTIYSGTSSTEPDAAVDTEPGRPRWVVPVVIAVILLLVTGGVLAAFFFGEDDDEPGTVLPTATPTATDETSPSAEPTEQETEATADPTETAVETPSPTEEPTEAPSEELREDLEVGVTVDERTFELTEEGLVADDGLLERGAVEAWRGTYASEEDQVELLGTLWADNEAADAFAAELVEGVDGEQVDTGFTYTNETGTFWAFLLADGRGSYIWTTDRGHVLQVIGSPDYVGGFYAGFPL